MLRGTRRATWFAGIVGALALLAIGYLVIPASSFALLADPYVKVATQTGHGSATHIGNGNFLTAAHVVAGDSAPTIDGKPAEVLWINAAYDIALLRGPVGHGAVPLSCVTPAIGVAAEAHGNPMDLLEITTSVRVAGSARQLRAWRVAVPVDGALAPGMSGGGVVVGGHLVGVTVGVSVANLGMFPSLYGVGFIVPGEAVCQLMGRA